MQAKHLAAIAFLASLAVTDARADEIWFRNGDRLSGKLVHLVEGKLVFASSVAGEVTVDPATIAGLATEETAEVHLDDGSMLVDRLQRAEEGSFSTAGAGTVGPQTLALARAVAINPPVEEPDVWSGKLLAGVDFSRGNTFKDSADAELSAKRRTDADRLQFFARYEGERSKNLDTGISTTTDRNLKGRVTYDYFITEKLFWFATSYAEKDGPSDLNLRFVAGGGLGYDWLATDRTTLTLRAGPTWTSENYESSDQDHDDLALLAEWLLEHKLRDPVTYFFNGVWLPTIGGGGDMLLQSETGFRFDLTTRLFAEAKYRLEWDSEPADGKKQEDVDYIFSLGWKF